MVRARILHPRRMSGKEQGLREIIIIFGALVIAALGIAAGKYYSDRRRYFRQSGQFARRNGLAIEEVSVAGLDIALSGRLDGRSIKTSAGLDQWPGASPPIFTPMR
jgi:hypothetical protein